MVRELLYLRKEHMQIDENDPRNVRAGGRARPRSIEERQTVALESIADSLATIATKIKRDGASTGFENPGR